jgi:hypothetical protein
MKLGGNMGMLEFEVAEVESDVELNGDTAEISLEDLTKEELIELVIKLLSKNEEEPQKNTYLTEPFEVSEEDIVESKEYQDGVKVGNKLVGLYSALVSGGLSLEVAQDIVVNEHTYDKSSVIIKEQSKTAKRASGLA